jgi:hypothetical protein
VSGLLRLFDRVARPIPPILDDWDDQVALGCEAYKAKFPQASFSEINLDLAVFVFDHASERVTLAYAVSVEQLMARDTSRMRGFPDVNISVRKVLGDSAFPADRGHFLGHGCLGRSATAITKPKTSVAPSASTAYRHPMYRKPRGPRMKLKTAATTEFFFRIRSLLRQLSARIYHAPSSSFVAGVHFICSVAYDFARGCHRDINQRPKQQIEQASQHSSPSITASTFNNNVSELLCASSWSDRCHL